MSIQGGRIMEISDILSLFDFYLGFIFFAIRPTLSVIWTKNFNYSTFSLWSARPIYFL